jgi:hypothetical protein
MTQVAALRGQMLDAVEQAVADGALRRRAARKLRRLGAGLGELAGRRSTRKVARFHRRAARALGRACRLLTTASQPAAAHREHRV